MDEDLRAALRPIGTALRANTTALTAIRDQLIADGARGEELLRRVESALERAEVALERVEGPPMPENPRVAEARADLAIDRITLYRRALGAPITVGRWLAADRARTVLLVSTILGIIAQLTSGAPIISTLGRALLAWGNAGVTP